MGLSIAQMARMSQLLDEALPLDEAGRRARLERLSPEHGDLAAALRAALSQSEGQAADLKVLSAAQVGGAGERHQREDAYHERDKDTKVSSITLTEWIPKITYHAEREPQIKRNAREQAK